MVRSDQSRSAEQIAGWWTGHQPCRVGLGVLEGDWSGDSRRREDGVAAMPCGAAAMSLLVKKCGDTQFADVVCCKGAAVWQRTMVAVYHCDGNKAEAACMPVMRSYACQTDCHCYVTGRKL